jgi:hypothetical protein
MFRKEIRDEIEIQASPEAVWKILTDFEDFREWNAFMRPVVGEAEEGAKLRVQIRPPGGKAMAFRPRVTKVVSNRELRWEGRLWIPGLLDGEHIFEIEPLGSDRSKFVQREVFTGLFVPLMAKNIENQTLPGFEKMNRALKERVEAGGEGARREMMKPKAEIEGRTQKLVEASGMDLFSSLLAWGAVRISTVKLAAALPRCK